MVKAWSPYSANGTGGFEDRVDQDLTIYRPHERRNTMIPRKQALFCVVVVGLLLVSFTASVQADDERGGRSCDPAGLWFGFPLGNPPFKVVSIIPVNGGMRRYILSAEDQDPADTPFRGEMVRVGKNVYKLWGMQYITLAPDVYGYMVVSGDWAMSDCMTAEGDYLVSLYNTDPFHDEGAIPFFNMQVLNLYERMPSVNDSSNF
jgi:hypothetical protein